MTPTGTESKSNKQKPIRNSRFLFYNSFMSYIIAGLGNPGQEYENTRHNVGRMFVEYLRKKEDFPEWREDKNSKP